MLEHLVMANFSDDDLDSSQWGEIRGAATKITLVERPAGNAEGTEFLDAIRTCDGLIVKVASKVPAAIFEAAPNLKYLGIYATGYGGIDMAAAKRAGVTVTNVAGYSTTAVAELSIAMMLNALRHIPGELVRTSAHDFSEPPNSRDLSSRHVGVVGMGAIGSRVTSILTKGFGCHVSYFSRTRREQLESDAVTYAPLAELVKSVDILTLHVPAGSSPLVTAELMEAAKAGLILINTSPNETVDLDALEARLTREDIVYAFDHTDELPHDTAVRLVSYPTCTGYPPMGYTTEEADQLKREILTKNIVAFVSGEPQNVVS